MADQGVVGRPGGGVRGGTGDVSGRGRDDPHPEAGRGVRERADAVVHQPDRRRGGAEQTEQPAGDRTMHALGNLGDLAERGAQQGA